MTWTVDDIMAHGPCRDFPRERVTELFAGRQSVTLAEIVATPVASTAYEWVVGKIGRTSTALSGADLSGANLRDTDLHGANLRGADLSDATMPEGLVE